MASMQCINYHPSSKLLGAVERSVKVDSINSLSTLSDIHRFDFESSQLKSLNVPGVLSSTAPYNVPAGC